MKKNSLFLKQIPRRIKKLILRDYIEKYLKKNNNQEFECWSSKFGINLYFSKFDILSLRICRVSRQSSIRNHNL